MIYTLAITKGGTGKTTTAAALTHLLAKNGKKVLAIDLDPQANLTTTLGATDTANNILEVLNGRKVATECISSLSDNISIIPSTWNLSKEKLKDGAALRLQTAIKDLKKKYNDIVIDTPPTAAEFQYIGIMCADEVIIPVQPDIYGIQSIYQTDDVIKQIRQYNKSLKRIDLIITNVNTRSTLNRQLIGQLETIADELKLKYLGVVRNGIAVKEAATLKASLYDYAPKSNPTSDYMDALGKIL